MAEVIAAGGNLTPEMLEFMAKIQSLGRVVDPQDAPNAALFLASDPARNVTDVNLPVDGGVTAGRR